MPTIKNFEDLNCWQEARKIVSMIYNMTKKQMFKSDYALANQIKRSSISIMANIAEGFHRNSSKDFMKFLNYSRSSCAETLSHLYIALDQNYITDTDLEQTKVQIQTTWKKINSLISYLNQNDQDKPNRVTEDLAEYIPDWNLNPNK